MSHNFILSNCDTDSLSVCKDGGTPFTEQERKDLLVELNSLMPKNIVWEDDGYYPSFCVLKAKNYILLDEKGKLKIRGSALRSSKTEPAFKDFISEVINVLLFGKQEELIGLYHKYIIKIHKITDITPWAKKVTITEKVLNPERTNERKVLEGLNGRQVQQGDKRYFYFAQDTSLKLVEDWNNDHDVNVLIEKLYKTLNIFKNVIDMSQFTKFYLKGKKKDLEALLTNTNE